MNAAITVLLLVSVVQGQTFQTPIPPNITVQPTDLLTAGAISGLRVLPLAVQSMAIEYLASATVHQMLIPCRAVANPQKVRYSWYKWQNGAWSQMANGAGMSWSVELNGDPSVAGALTINPFDKVQHEGAYTCRATCEGAVVEMVSVSKVLNLTATYFRGEGTQASQQTATYATGAYVNLTGVVPKAWPMLNASWVRTGDSSVPSGTAKEIPPERVLMDENNNLHIPYLDASLTTVSDTSGTQMANFYHLKSLSLRYILTNLAQYKITVSGAAPAIETCTLRYQTPRLSLVRGENSRFVCVFAGSPSIKVTYLKSDANGNFQPLTNMVVANGDSGAALMQTGIYGNTYMIGVAQPSDAGTYSCYASYAGGRCPDVAKTITVTVNSEPTFVMQPDAVVYVVEGRSATLEWRISGTAVTSEVNQNGAPLVTDPAIIVSSVKDVGGVVVRTVTIIKARKPVDTRSLQVQAINDYYIAISSVGVTVVSPISLASKMPDQLNIPRGSKATFQCVAYGDDALAMRIQWTRFYAGVSYPLMHSDKGQFEIAKVDVSAPSGLKAFSEVLTVDTSKVDELELSRGQYSCNVSNAVTWNTTSARLSFYGEDPVAASFELWMLGPILGGVAAIILVVGIIFVMRHNRGEKYEVEDEEIKKGFDPKKEAHEQRELQEYQRDREKGDEPLARTSQIDDEIEDEEQA